MQHSYNKGFTLIELILVIVLLGILAATAAPKFIDLKTDATIATLNGMKGALVSGSKLIYAKAIIDNKTVGDDTLTVSGVTISINSGYPVGNLSGVKYAVNLDDITFTSGICEEEWCGLGNQTSTPSGVTSTGDGRIAKLYPKGYSYNDECGVYYINHKDGSDPIIDIESNDC